MTAPSFCGCSHRRAMHSATGCDHAGCLCTVPHGESGPVAVEEHHPGYIVSVKVGLFGRDFGIPATRPEGAIRLVRDLMPDAEILKVERVGCVEGDGGCWCQTYEPPAERRLR